MQLKRLAQDKGGWRSRVIIGGLSAARKSNGHLEKYLTRNLVCSQGNVQLKSLREEATSALAGFACRSSDILVELEFGDVGFCGGKKTRKPGEKLSGK